MTSFQRGQVLADGWLKGHKICQARKAGRCQFWWGSLVEGGRCKNIIQAGDLYAAGEMNEDAGGYGQDRYCLECLAQSDPAYAGGVDHGRDE